MLLILICILMQAWADADYCESWVLTDLAEYINSPEYTKVGAAPREFLLFSDNLHGQKTESFKSHLRSLGGSSHNLLPGNTDELQPVDRGVGSALKRECGEVQDEWLRIPENFKEWKEDRLSASRRRILLTHWYAEAWGRMLKKFNMVKVRIRQVVPRNPNPNPNANGRPLFEQDVE